MSMNQLSEALEMAINETVEEKLSDLSDRIEEALDACDFGDAIDEAINGHDFSDEVADALRDFDFSEAIDNHDYSRLLRCPNVTEKIHEVIDDYACSDQFDAFINKKITERLDGIKIEEMVELVIDRRLKAIVAKLFGI